jgi:TolB-like protein/cytochrome c-type biogenesis protein CcmH/NrfG
MLSYLCAQDYVHGYDLQADALEAAAFAARRAVELGPSNHLSYFSLAQSLSYQKDFDSFRDAAERAVELNPMDGNSVALLGELLIYAGSDERGMQLAERAKRLNPNHPGWYWFADFYHAFSQGDYHGALGFALKVKLRGNPLAPMFIAAASGQLGEADYGSKAVRDLLKFRPELPALMGKQVAKIWNSEYGGRFLEGLRKAGLEIPEVGDAANRTTTTSSSSRSAAVANSGEMRAEEGFWVAILPFKYGGADPSLTALTEGLTEEIVTGLSRFSYLRVIARSSTSRYANESVDVRTAGKELGARYVMEGSLRQAGTKLRLAVQLVDATSGAHLWAENFERTFSPETVFELQDDLVPRIVSTVADMYGVLTRSMSEALRGKADEELSPHEAVLSAFGYMERVTPEEHARVRGILERAVRMAPNQSDAWAMLANLYWEEHAHGLNPQPDPLGRALAAARRAVEAAPSNNLAHYALASTLFFQKDFLAFRSAAERAIELNRMDASVAAFIGNLIAYSGDWERGCAVVESAMQLNPRHPGWYYFASFNDAYRRRNYRGALDFALKINLPGNFYTHAVIAAAYGQLGMREEARKALQELLAIRPDFAKTAREEHGRWFPDLAFVEHLLDGLRKAGLEIAREEGSAALPAPGDVPHSEAKTESGAARADEGFWVAVLPFKYGGAEVSLTNLAEGLTEEIVTGLSRFSYLRVISRRSAADAQSAGKELGARYVMEGSLRQAGSRLRIAVQLVDAVSGAHLWAENYERAFTPEAVFELQDDLVPRIVSTCADRFGVLARSISDAVRGGEPRQLGPYEALMRGFGYHQRLTPVEHAEAREALERAVERAPSNADCWAMLSWIYSHEHAHGFNVRPGSLDRALAAARRAVDIAPSSQLAQQALAVVLFFRKETAGCLGAAERAIALNPLDTSNEAIFLITFTGDWVRGCALIRRAMELNPHHPRWYGTVLGMNEYRLANYRAAVDEIVKANAPDVFWTSLLLAAAHGQLGELTAARDALRDLLGQKEDLAQSASQLLGKWFDPQMVELLMEGLRKAGLDAGAPALEAAQPPAPISGAVRAEEGFWVAVLPFKSGGGNTDLATLAEGLTEEIVTGLSRFSYLKVIARSSTSRYASEAVDVRTAGKDLGARYVMEGNLRQAGPKLRLAVQLVDAASGAHLWAESYERTFSAEAVFELQDELVPRIVSTVADTNGVLPRSMSEALRSRTPEQLSPYEAVLRSFGYSERATAEELAAALSGLGLAVQKAPAYADAWAMLGLLRIQDYAQGFKLQADSLAGGLTAARRAVEAAPSNHLAQSSLAQALFFHKEFQSFRNAAERAAALNPMNGDSIAFLGELLTYAGDRERGLALAGRAKQLNPNHPGWYWYADFYDAYRRGDDRGALSVALKVNLPGHWFMHAALAAAYGQLGERGAAAKAVQDLLKLRPDFAATVRSDIEKWWEPEYVERMIDGWRKAGLEIAAPAEAGPAPAPPEAPVAIAVLPFADMSAAKDQEYLCEGMSEEIMNALVRVGGIRVASRTSAFRASRNERDVAAIGRALSVGQVLEGSVRTAGDRLRVTAQLTDVASGFQLWSERFDRDATDVFAVQDEIAAGVVDAVKARLAPGARTVQPRAQVRNLEAYRRYLKGRHLRGKEDHAGALRAFEEAVRLDPSHAPSWTGLAEITVLAAHMGMILPRAACTAARKALATARELQGESAEGLHVEAFAAFLERRWDAMETAWRRALELQPDHVLALGSFAISLCARQRLDEALPLFERAREADPLASFPYMLAGWGLLVSGRPEEGLRHIEDALTFEKEDASAIGASCIANSALGRFEEAVAAGERGVAVTHRAPFFLGVLGWALATAGRKDEARKILEELRARPAGSPTAVSEAWLLGALGEIDDAFEVLARAEEEYQGLLSYTGLPSFDSLRADPRFGALLERLELPSA